MRRIRVQRRTRNKAKDFLFNRLDHKERMQEKFKREVSNDEALDSLRAFKKIMS